jgi:hypothetical protein
MFMGGKSWKDRINGTGRDNISEHGGCSNKLRVWGHIPFSISFSFWLKTLQNLHFIILGKG